MKAGEPRGAARFVCGHATHPDWRMAARLVVAQLHAAAGHVDDDGKLGLLYITDHYAGDASALLEHLRLALPGVTDWVGTVGVGIAAGNAEYFDEPALALMLCPVHPSHYRVFSGLRPLRGDFHARCALVHADARTPELPGLLRELAERTSAGHLFGGLTSSRGDAVQYALSRQPESEHDGVLHGGLSGVAFAAEVALHTRVTQGCLPVGEPHRVTGAEGNVITALDGQPALEVLLQTMQIALDDPPVAMQRLRETLVGLRHQPTHRPAPVYRNQLGDDVLVRNLIGLDLTRHGVAVAGQVASGDELTFCRRNIDTARADLMRICAEIRESLEPDETAWPTAGDRSGTASGGSSRMAGAIYVSCASRGGPYFGAPSAELQIVRHALGEVPLIGFFAGGEIAGRDLYGYTGVLTVFTAPR